MMLKRRKVFDDGILRVGSPRHVIDLDSSDDESNSVNSDLARLLPRDALAHIRLFSDPGSRLRSSLTSSALQEAMREKREDASSASEPLVCLLVFKLGSRMSPKTGDWEGSSSRAAYWWVGRRAVLRGPSNKPPEGVSKKPGGPEVNNFCLGDGYPRRCLAFMQGLEEYVGERWRRHLARQPPFARAEAVFVLFERNEDAHFPDQWRPPFSDDDCLDTGCCAAVIVPWQGKAFLTLAHASSIMLRNKRNGLLSTTPSAELSERTAPHYVDFFLKRGATNCSIRYISLWHQTKCSSGRMASIPPVSNFRLFGTEFAEIHAAETMPICDGPVRAEEIQTRQFARADLKLNIDLHAISAPFRPK